MRVILIDPQQQPETPRRTGCSRPLKACALILALLAIAFIATLIYMIRLPVVRSLVKCQSNMMAISAAIKRYNDVNGAYPPNLMALKKDYLKAPSVLRCPLSELGSDKPSYIYHRPGPNAPDDFAILECKLHKLRPDVPISKLQLLKNGTIRPVTPKFKEVLREQSKQRK